jgi:hypothetical protein
MKICGESFIRPRPQVPSGRVCLVAPSLKQFHRAQRSSKPVVASFERLEYVVPNTSIPAGKCSGIDKER